MATEPAGAFTVRFAERAGDLGAAAAAPGAVAVADASTYSLEGTTVAEGRRETTTFAAGSCAGGRVVSVLIAEEAVDLSKLAPTVSNDTLPCPSLVPAPDGSGQALPPVDPCARILEVSGTVHRGRRGKRPPRTTTWGRPRATVHQPGGRD